MNVEDAVGTHIVLTCRDGFSLAGILTATMNMDGRKGILMKPAGSQLCVWCPMDVVLTLRPSKHDQSAKHADSGPNDAVKSSQILWTAANAYEEFAKDIEAYAGESLAAYAYRSAADIDAMNDQLPNDLGGPFNGQVIRRKIFWDLIQKLSISVVIETGT